MKQADEDIRPTQLQVDEDIRPTQLQVDEDIRPTQLQADEDIRPTGDRFLLWEGSDAPRRGVDWHTGEDCGASRPSHKRGMTEGKISLY